MVNNVIGVVNYVIAARPSLLNFMISYMNEMAALCEHVISQSGGLRHTDFAALNRSLRCNINSARCTRPGRAGPPVASRADPSRATAALHAASDGYPGCLD